MTTQFAQIPACVITAPVTATAVRVYAAMALKAVDRRAFQSAGSLADATRLSRRQVMRALNDLAEAGLIRRTTVHPGRGVVEYELAWDEPFPDATCDTHDIGGVTPVSQVGCDTGVTGGMTPTSQGCDTSVIGGVTPTSHTTYELSEELTDELTHKPARELPAPSPSRAECGEPQERDIKNEEPKAKNAPAGHEQAPATGLAADALDAIERILWPANKSLSEADTLSAVKIIARHERTVRRDDLLRLAREWAEAWAGGKLDSLGSLHFALSRGFVPARTGKPPAPPVSLPGVRDTPWGPEGMINMITGELMTPDFDPDDVLPPAVDR